VIHLSNRSFYLHSNGQKNVIIGYIYLKWHCASIEIFLKDYFPLFISRFCSSVMSAVESAPPRPPRPTLPRSVLKSKKEMDKKLGISLDLESVDFGKYKAKELS